MTRYTLTYGSIVRVLADAPEGWDTLQSNIIRNETYHGIFRELNANLRFVTTGAALLRHAYLTEGVEAKVTLRIESYDTLAMLWRDIMTSGECDLTQAVDTLMYFECPVIDGGTVALVKANADVKYTIPTPGDTILRYLGVRLYSGHANWLKGLYNIGARYWYNHTTLPYGVNIPIAISGTPTDASLGGYLPYTISEAPPWGGYFFKAVRHCVVDLDVSASSVDMTTYLKDDYYNGSPGFPNELDRWYCRLYIVVTSPSGTTATLISERSVIPTQHSGGYYTNTVGGSVNYSGQLTLEAGSFVFLTWAWVPTDPAQLSSDNGADFSETAMSVSADVQSVLPQIDIPAFKAKDLFTSIIAQIDPTATVQSTYLDGLAANEQPLILSGDAIRGISPYNVKVSLSDFYKSMQAVFNLGLGVSGSVVMLEQMSYFYSTASTLNIGEVKGLKISTAADLLFKTIDVGYPVQEYKELNGRDEFNAGQQWVLPFTKINSGVENKSPIRADMYGIDSLRITYYGNTNTDTESDNALFMVDSEFVETLVGVDYYICSRSKATYISGLTNADTAYNIFYSPKRCLLRHGSELRSAMWGITGNIKLASADKNTALVSTISGVTVFEATNIAPASLTAARYYPIYFEFDAAQSTAMWSTLLTAANNLIKFSYKGVTLYGYVMEAGVNADHRTTISYRLLCSTLTDLTDILNL
jgi:hypothetical protein